MKDGENIMKNKMLIIVFTLVFTMFFNTIVSAKTLPSVNNVPFNKIWTVTFNKDIKTMNATIIDQNKEEIVCNIEINKNKATINALLGYIKGNYTLIVTKAISKDGAILKEPVEMNFTVTN